MKISNSLRKIFFEKLKNRLDEVNSLLSELKKKDFPVFFPATSSDAKEELRLLMTHFLPKIRQSNPNKALIAKAMEKLSRIKAENDKIMSYLYFDAWNNYFETLQHTSFPQKKWFLIEYQVMLIKYMHLSSEHTTESDTLCYV
jgi:hypothetical protein